MQIEGNMIVGHQKFRLVRINVKVFFKTHKIVRIAGQIEAVDVSHACRGYRLKRVPSGVYLPHLLRLVTER